MRVIEAKQKLFETPKNVRYLLANLDEAEMNVVTPACERSVAQLVFHLDYYEQLYLSCYLREFLFRRVPKFQSFSDEELWNTRRQDTVEAQLKSFEAERFRNVDLLDLVDRSVLERDGFHEKHGKISLQRCLDTVVNHDAYHLGHFREMREYLQRTSAV